ncbi:MAG: hypothetical protein AAB706_02120 [Patescibacteria group bacterium]
MNKGDIITEVLVRTGKNTASGWLSDTFLNDWVSQSHQWAAGFKKWPFTEGRISTTYSTTEEWDFEGYKADSFRFMQIGGKRLRKLNFADYQIFKEESPSANDRVFSDFGGLVFINPNIDLSGTLTAWGQYAPAKFDATDLTENTVFSEGNDEGNQAVIEEIIGFIFKRDGKKDDALKQHQIASALLAELWQRIQDEQYAYQTHSDRGGMFERFDVLRGGASDEILRRDQF